MWDRVNRLTELGAAATSLVTGAGAVAASSCCVLPLALSVAGLGGSWIAGIGGFGTYQPWLLSAAGAALVVGWLAVLRRRWAGCAAGSRCGGATQARLVHWFMGASTLLFLIAAAWAWIEPVLMTALLRLPA